MATKTANRSVATAMAIAGRSSRACDVCANKSARLYCAADEAYLCDRCDTQVHSANALALRHERVRLAPNGAPMKIPRTTSCDTSTKEPAAAFKVTKSLSQDILPTFKSSKSASNHKDAEVPQKSIKKKHQNLHSPPAQVLPCRKRSRTSRPHPLHHVKLDSCNSISKHQGSVELFSHLKAPKSSVKVEREAPAAAAAVESVKVKVEQIPLFDLFDTDDFLTDCPQEVPSFITVMDHHQHTSSDSSGSDPELSCSDFSSEVQYATSDHSVPSSDSGGFAAYFKGKAGDADQFLVPESCAFDYSLDDSGIVGDMCVEIDSSVSFAGDACFIPGEIPGLDGFEDFGCPRNLTDEYAGLNFDLPLNGGSEAFEGDVSGDTSEAGGVSSDNNGDHVLEIDQSLMEGPFAKFFAEKGRSSTYQKQSGMSPEKIKDAAKEILRCCREGLSEEEERLVPSLRLNYDDVLTAWSDRGDPWVDFKRAVDESNSTGSDACLVPDMGQGAGDDGQSGGHREAKVLRYKEKRANRLFSKKIRYEVRKLNAERRPRMKGRFVKRTGEL